MCWRSWKSVAPDGEFGYPEGCVVDIFSIVAIASFRRRLLSPVDERKYAMEHWILLEAEVKNWSERYKHLSNVFEYPIRLFPQDISPLHWMIRAGEWELARCFIKCPFFPQEYRFNVPYRFVPWCKPITPMTLARLIHNRTDIWPAVDKIERIEKITEVMWLLYSNGALDSIVSGEAYRKQRENWGERPFFQLDHKTYYEPGDLRSIDGTSWRAYPFYGETPEDFKWYEDNAIFRKHNHKYFERLVYHGDEIDPFLQDDSAIRKILF
jgi:hypothetical protein